MRIFKLYFNLIILKFIIFASCSKDPCLSLFKDEKVIQSEIINFKDKFPLANPFLLTKIDSFIILADVYDKKLFTIINLYDKNIYRFGRIGHGPGEFLIGSFVCGFNEKKDIYFYNPSFRKLYKANINNIIKYTNYNPIEILSFNKQNISKLDLINDSLFIVQGKFGNYRLVLLNNKGKILDSTLQYPEYKKTINPIFYELAFQGKVSVNSKSLKFVHITYKSSNIGFYKIINNKIVVIKEIFLKNPSMKLINLSGNIMTCLPDKNCIHGYLDVYTSNNFVYAIYNNKKVSEENNLLSSNVLVFDWDGKPIKILKLDKKVSFICASDDDSFIYAISYENEKINLLSYRL